MSSGTPVPPAGPQVHALNCPGCGASLAVRSMGRAVTIVCSACHCILDANDPNLRILQRFKAATSEEAPLIPLGSRGKWRGAVYEVIGFQRRTAHADGEFSWHEYVLFNPYKGFRYFTECSGHWNDATPVTALPEVRGETAKYLGTTYDHFQTVTARTKFVLGEFPWQVSVNDAVTVSDYIAPPHVLSREETGNEVTWSLGEYVSGTAIWKSFSLAGLAPAPIGVYENQPSPLRASSAQIWMAFFGLGLLVLAMFVGNLFLAQGVQVLREAHTFSSSEAEPSFVTPIFQLTGRTSAVEFRTEASVLNQWIYLNYSLINDQTGQAYDIGREVSYYSGSDSDGPWTEGSKTDDVVLPSIPPGRYYLRIEPESDASLGRISYTLTVTRDVVVPQLYLLALAALLVPALLISWRTFNFEQLRWAESDHPNPSFFGSLQ